MSERYNFRELSEEEGDSEADTWCEVTIQLEGEPGQERLSITGMSGYALTHEAAHRAAQDLWESFFEENPDERVRLMDREEKYLSDADCAKMVLQTDGELAGLDVHTPQYGLGKDDKVYIVSSCGQIIDTIKKFFPAMAPYMKYHLNDMHAECVHMAAKGLSYQADGKVVCRECDPPYTCGSAWKHHPLPEDVIEWARHGEVPSND